MRPVLNGRPHVPQSLAVARRRTAVREEGKQHRMLAKLLNYYIDPNNTFWTSIENRPLSLISGVVQKKRGVRSGMPDVAVYHRRGGRIKIVFIELKSRVGVLSDSQKQVREELLRIGARWWLVRSALAGVEALYRSGVVFRRDWPPVRLAPWEGPAADPKELPWAPSVLAQWRREKRRSRLRCKARLAAQRAAAPAASAGAITPTAAP
jgi:hypothetical protein